MKKSLLTVFAPLAVLSLAFTSCNKGGGGFNPKRRDIELERIDYVNHSNYSGAWNLWDWQLYNEGFAKVIGDAKTNQVDSAKKYQLVKYGLGKGTMTTNIELDVGGKGVVILENIPPIDINSIKGGLGDTVTTSWSIGDEYIKSVDSLGGVNYIVKEEATNKYWRCVKTNFKDNNYRMDITDYVKAAGGFENVVMMETADNSSIIHDERETWEAPKKYISQFFGLDLTGFGGNYVEDPETNDEISHFFENKLAIGSILTDKFEITGYDIPVIDDYTMLDILDLVTEIIDSYLPDLGVDLIEFAYNNSAKEADAGYVDVGFREENLSLIKEVYDAVASYFKEYESELPFVIEESTGNGTIDFFTAYEDNFIRQQELVIDVTDTNFVLSPNIESETPLPMLVDLKGANVRAIINSNTEKGKCLVDNVKLSDYIDVTPPPVQ